MLANVQYSYNKIQTAPHTLSPTVRLLSPLKDFGAHLDQAVLGIAVGEWRDGLDGLVDVVLCQGAGLLETGAGKYDFACLSTKLA
jgi:hypothetical protein